MGSTAQVLNCTHICGYLASPNYPANYPDSTTISWNIKIPGYYYIRLEFISMKLESAEPDCAQDYLDIYHIGNTGSKRLLGKYCIANLPPPALFSGMNQMNLILRSDSQNSNSGFLAHYSPEQYTLPDAIKRKISTSGKTILWCGLCLIGTNEIMVY